MQTQQIVQIARQYGTPLYIFDTDALARRLQAVQTAFGPAVRLCYSIKANPFLTGVMPLTLLEVCSPGELEICRSLAVPPDHILYSGVNKTLQCVEDALDYGVGVLTAESPLHLSRIEQAAAERGLTAGVLLRLTGGDQFGMGEAALRELVRTRAAFSHCRITGLHFFSGTQKRNAKIIERELVMLAQFADALQRDFGFAVQALEYGAGLFSDYFGPDPDAREAQLLEDVAPAIQNAAKRFRLTVEMGRFFTADCGMYVTAVDDIKPGAKGQIAIVDGGLHQMNYDGLILAPAPPPITALTNAGAADVEWAVYGSLCSRGDVLAKSVRLPALQLGDLLCFGRAGAYGITEGMALFLSRDIPAVVLHGKGTGTRLVRGHRSTHALNTPQPDSARRD